MKKSDSDNAVSTPGSPQEIPIMPTYDHSGTNTAATVIARPRFLKLHRMNLGISYKNMFSCYLGSMLSVCFFVFMNAAQPFVLENFLHTPDDDQGTVSGDLAFYSELMILVTSHLWGTASDKIGRRIVYVSGMVFISAGFTLYPLASSFWMLLLFRLVFAVGASACAAMLSAVLGDYVFMDDRGRASGLLGLSAGFGAVMGALFFLQLPGWLHDENKNLSLEDAGRITYFTVAAVALSGAALLWFGLRKRTKATNFQTHKSLFVIAKEGFIAGKNPVLSLAYGSGFAARGDSSIAATFLTLWVFQAALSKGLTSTAALSRAGVVSGVAQTCALGFAPFAGILCDKLHRVKALIVVSLIAAIGYTTICLSSDPLGWEIMFGACVVGMGEIGLVVSSTALVSQESPPLIRGSTSGFFSLCGAFGILVATKVGGELFSHWDPSGPFLLFGAFNAMLVVWGIFVYLYIQINPNYNPYKILQSALQPEPKVNQSEGNISTFIVQGNHNEEILENTNGNLQNNIMIDSNDITIDDDFEPDEPNHRRTVGESSRLLS
eukprot:TRINITY_DN6251_c0_g1_i3.p1 TRINITY_DN6251_c0_g1~~TRINITY_DN6251_c0_g1_i3.p1  ORF type:complete len:550 (-),score=92.77 TRINITY_DN6251_c0_g1_i3:189-1838(-)